MIRLFAMVVALGLGCGFGAQGAEAKGGADVAELFRELKSMDLKAERGWDPYSDLHGNQDGRLQAIMIGRFENTAAVCRELDGLEKGKFNAYRNALYRCLGTVKDPAAIEWFGKRLRTDKDEIVARFLPEWRLFELQDAGPEMLRWLEGGEKWSAFFINWHRREKDREIRSELLRVIQGWFHGPEVLAFFRRVQEGSTVSDEDFLLAELYLRRHGEHGDAGKLRDAIGRLAAKRSSREFFLSLADEMCDEAFVPALIKMVEPRPRDDYKNAQWHLERITLRHDMNGRAAWQKWAEREGQKGRAAWVAEASERILELARTNTPAAKEFLDSDGRMYLWKGPDMLATMKALAEHQVLQSKIVGWINLTRAHYEYVPGLEKELMELANRIKTESEGKLEPWAKRIMDDWDYWRTISWEKWVQIMNMRV